MKTYVAVCLRMLLIIPSKGFIVVRLQQVCIHDLNVMCIIKFKKGCLSPSEIYFFFGHSPQKKPNAAFKETYDFEPKLIKFLNNIFWKHTFSSQLGKVLHGAACIMAVKQGSYQECSLRA